MEKLGILAFVLPAVAYKAGENAGMKRCFYITVFFMYYEIMAEPGGKKKVLQLWEYS